MGDHREIVALQSVRWRDPSGRVHVVDGAEVLPGKILRWTRCGLYDLPADEGWRDDEAPTCAACRIWVDMNLSPLMD